MRFVALALSLALPAFAEERLESVPVSIRVLPDGSRQLSAEDWVRVANRIETCEAKGEASSRVSPIGPLVTLAVVLGIGVALGYAAHSVVR